MQELQDNERAFAEHYVTCYRKDLAAIKAGYSEHTAAVIGHQVYNRPHVKEYIEKLLDESTIGAKETLKLMSDATQSNMSDYMHEVEYLDVPKVKKGLQAIIDQLQYEIEIEQDFLQLAENLSKKEKERSQNIIRSHELEITRFSIELEKNPSAYRIVDGDPVLKKEMRLDLYAIAKDKERGRIKSYKMTKDGVQVELQSPSVAVELAKIHGLYKEDNQQKAALINTSKLSDEDILTVIALSKKASADNS